MWNMKSVFAFHRGLKKKEKKKEDAKENNFRKKRGSMSLPLIAMSKNLTIAISVCSVLHGT